VSTPITWDEAADATAAADLRFEAADVVARLDEHGDLFGDMDAARAPLP
jgi:bifunctional non-homologous end joining protein LigD